MTYDYYKTFIRMASFEDASADAINDLLEEMANSEELTNAEYTDLYQMVIDRIK